MDQELAYLNQVMQTVNSTLDLDTVMNSVTEALRTIFSFDQIGIFLVDEEEQELRPMKYYGKGISEEILNKFKELHLPLKGNLSSVVNVVMKNRHFYIASVTPELVDNFTPMDREIYERNPVKGYLLYPLHVQSRTIGIIVFAHTQQEFALSSKGIEQVQRYITQIAASIQNAQLFEESQKARQEVDKKNELLQSLSNKLAKYLS